MSWHTWVDELHRNPSQAVADLLRGAASISPFERVTPHEFLLAVLPRGSRQVNRRLLGEPESESLSPDPTADLPALLDQGLSAWLLAQRQASLPAPRKLSGYVAQVSEALQWPLYLALPHTRAALQAERAHWLGWLGALTLTAYRDPEFDYWQVLAAQQTDDNLQSFWQLFVVEAGRTLSGRYLSLGLLALARLPLSEDDSRRNLRLQVQALVNRYQRRKGSGVLAQQDMADSLRDVMARNPSMAITNYRAFLWDSLSPLGDDKRASLLTLLGLGPVHRQSVTERNAISKLTPPAGADEARRAVELVHRSSSLTQAWHAIRPLLTAHEDFLHKSGDPYYFVRTLDQCARALCNKYLLREPEIQSRLFQWIHLALRVDANDPRLWMLWELALRQADHPQRARWVLWEMTRRFPDQLPCRVELARMLAESGDPDDLAQTQRLLQQVLVLDPQHVHAHSVLAKLAIRRSDWNADLAHAQDGLRADPANQFCALLQASAYARRGGPDDLQTAISGLERFVGRYPGSLNAENYLGTLVSRQRQQAQGRLRTFEDDNAQATPSTSASPETDPAWAAFAQSIKAWVALSAAPQGVQLAFATGLDRVLPFPQAMKLALANQQWDADVLAPYNVDAQREFPLETRLWRYLQAVHTDIGIREREDARQALAQWFDSERREPSSDNSSWLSYLNHYWQILQGATDNALAAGVDWLQDLLDRYQPLPTPLLA